MSSKDYMGNDFANSLTHPTHGLIIFYCAPVPVFTHCFIGFQPSAISLSPLLATDG